MSGIDNKAACRTDTAARDWLCAEQYCKAMGVEAIVKTKLINTEQTPRETVAERKRRIKRLAKRGRR